MMIPMTLGDDDAAAAAIAAMAIHEPDRQAAIDAWRDPTPERFDALMDRMLLEIDGEDPKLFTDAEFLYQTIMLFRGYTPVLTFDRITLEHFGQVYSEMWFTPAYDRLRPTPEFVELIELAGLPAYWDRQGWPEYCARDDEGAIQCR